MGIWSKFTLTDRMYTVQRVYTQTKFTSIITYLEKISGIIAKREVGTTLKFLKVLWPL